MLIGLGALLIVGAAVVLLPKRGYKANASRKRKSRRRPAAKRRGRMKYQVVSTATGYVLHRSSTKAGAKKWQDRFAVGPSYKTVKI
jgi:isopenicillin N synthase-like dioxygenase